FYRCDRQSLPASSSRFFRHDCLCNHQRKILTFAARASRSPRGGRPRSRFSLNEAGVCGMQRRHRRRSRCAVTNQHPHLLAAAAAIESLECRRLLATHVWSGGGDGVHWSNAGNWTGGTPTSAEAGGTIVQMGGGFISTDDIAGLVVDQLHFTD